MRGPRVRVILSDMLLHHVAPNGFSRFSVPPATKVRAVQLGPGHEHVMADVAIGNIGIGTLPLTLLYRECLARLQPSPDHPIVIKLTNRGTPVQIEIQ